MKTPCLHSDEIRCENCNTILISRTYQDIETGIVCEIDEKTKRVGLRSSISLNSSYRRDREQFVFKESKPETVIKVAEAFIRLMRNI